MILSYSQLQTYRRCPKQYEYAFVKKTPRRISPGESFGSSIHNTLKRWGELELEQQKKEKKTPTGQLSLLAAEEQPAAVPPLSRTTLLTLWRECFIAEGYASRAEVDARLLTGEEVLRGFFIWWSKEQRTVVSVETGFKLTIPASNGTITLSGRIDRAERTKSGIRIIDYKTTEPQTQTQVDNDLQLSLYALAAAEKWGEAPDALVLLFLGEEKITERTTQRSTGQRKDAVVAIRTFHERIESADFRPTPGVPTCRGCPFRYICGARAV
ncbi:MAG: PD-(D/E)XK nuclease family protein [Candidatus Peribacteraceae bacterium]